MVEAPWPLVTDSVYSARLKSGAALHDVTVRVRHIRPTWTAGEQRYLVGLEFLAPESVAHVEPAP